MLHDLVVLHTTGALGALDDSAKGAWTHWGTCLRQVYFGDRSLVTESLQQGLANGQNGSGTPPQLKEGQEAYQYILEVICGLHSPMLGETEVLGQFRDMAIRSSEVSTEVNQKMKKFFLAWLSDAKVIRSKYLENLGAQSYGSLIRKMTKDHNKIHMLGGGQLAQEILPWLKHKEAQLLVRNPQKVVPLIEGFSHVKVAPLKEEVVSQAQVLVVAAPLSSQEIQNLLPGNTQIQMIIDLRGSSEADPLKLSQTQVYTLQKFFSEIDANQEKVLKKVKQAKQHIQQLTQDRWNGADVRPFGWDDICA